MADSELNDIYSNSFFQGLSRDDFNKINTDRFIRVEYRQNELILKQDDFGDVMYLIVSGKVLITKSVSGKEIELATRSSGEYIGEMALFDKHIRSANVIASTDVVLYEVNSELLFDLMNRFYIINLNLIKTINNAVRQTGIKLGENSINHDEQLGQKDLELSKTRELLNETIELKRYIDEQKRELELINKELEKRNRELYELSLFDDLTGLYSNNNFESQLSTEFFRSDKYNIDLAILVLGFDDFTDFNKNYGRFTGDKVLKEYAKFIKTQLECEDFSGRVGGDIAALALPHRGIDEALKLAEEIQHKTSLLTFDYDGVKKNLNITIGVSDNSLKNVKSGYDLLKSAKSAMMQGKSEGKNRIKRAY